MKTRQLLGSFLTAGACLCFVPMCSAAYDLGSVKGIEAFQGSAAARQLLAQNGFVVADPAFKQIFEAYIKSPQIKGASETNPEENSLPSLITADSAWHTYHVLLEEGVKELEEIQSGRLLDFSRRLLAAAKEQAQKSASDDDLVLFASVGLALQDEQHRKSLSGEAKRIVEELRTGSTPVAVPMGFALSPPLFRAQSFYTHSPDLSDYFAARQWYASVVFRLADRRETRAAITLARLVNSNPELLGLWRQLSEPLDMFLAPAEDGSVREYVAAAVSVLGTNATDAAVSETQLAEIRRRLESMLPEPRINDQLLLPNEYAEFGKQTRGFRLLPPRRLPCAVCFQNTVDPKIPGRMYPSGLDYLAASPVLRSPAAVRALQSQFGREVADLILKADCGPMPDSLHGEAMRLLATLQKPLPAQAPACMRGEAWADLQLWTQLGAWAEQRHTWALHTKLSLMYMGFTTPPSGMVVPYPEFFSGLAKLARQTAHAFERAGLKQEFEVKRAASDLLELLNLQQRASRVSAKVELAELERLSGKLEQLGQFQGRYYEKHRAELEKAGSPDVYRRVQKELEDLARRCAESGRANEAETETLRMFFDCRHDIARLLNDFAPVCDRLAELAGKSLKGQPLTEEDSKWIEGYGITLAGFHFYYENSYLEPRDDFPIVTRVYSNPLLDSTLYAGLGRPQALYVIVGDGESQQLYRGAVITYREFVRPNTQLLDDESWRELVSKGQTPSPPPFTRSFLAEKTAAEWIQSLRNLSFEAGYDDIRDILWHLGSQATEKELPDLIGLIAGLTTATNTRRTVVMIYELEDGSTTTNCFEETALWLSEAMQGLAEIIARLPWESHQHQLLSFLASTNTSLSDAAAHILKQRPASIDTRALLAGLDSGSARVRGLHCVLLGGLPQQTDQTRRALLRALRDSDDGVRWQAASAIAKAGCNDPQSQAALLESLNDTNEMVGVAATRALAQLRVTNAAPILLAKLKARLESTNAPAEELERQSSAVLKNMGADSTFPPSAELLDPDHLKLRLQTRIPDRIKKMASRRLPPRPFQYPTHDYSLTDALIEALGDLGYTPAADDLFKLRGTDYDAEATRALARLVPDRLINELLATAKDKQIDSYLREKALVSLCNISATNCVRELIPLLDDTTPIVYDRPSPGPEWRVCDRAAVTIATLLEWEHPLLLMHLRAERREELLTRAREWAKSVR